MRDHHEAANTSTWPTPVPPNSSPQIIVKGRSTPLAGKAGGSWPYHTSIMPCLGAKKAKCYTMDGSEPCDSRHVQIPQVWSCLADALSSVIIFQCPAPCSLIQAVFELAFRSSYILAKVILLDILLLLDLVTRSFEGLKTVHLRGRSEIKRGLCGDINRTKKDTNHTIQPVFSWKASKQSLIARQPPWLPQRLPLLFWVLQQ